jgi:hypothetical protein
MYCLTCWEFVILWFQVACCNISDFMALNFCILLFPFMTLCSLWVSAIFCGVILPPSSGYKIAKLDLWHNLHPFSLFHLYGCITGQFTNFLQIIWCLYIERQSSPYDTTATHVWVEVCCAIYIVTNSLSSSSSSSCHQVGPLVDLFQSHTFNSIVSCLPWFLLPFGL